MISEHSRCPSPKPLNRTTSEAHHLEFRGKFSPNFQPMETKLWLSYRSTYKAPCSQPIRTIAGLRSTGVNTVGPEYGGGASPARSFSILSPALGGQSLPVSLNQSSPGARLGSIHPPEPRAQTGNLRKAASNRRDCASASQSMRSISGIMRPLRPIISANVRQK